MTTLQTDAMHSRWHLLTQKYHKVHSIDMDTILLLRKEIHS